MSWNWLNSSLLPAVSKPACADRSLPKSESIEASFSASRISTSLLRLPCLVFRLRGLHAAVVFEVELVLPRRHVQFALRSCSGRRRKLRRGTEIHFGKTMSGFCQRRPVSRSARRPATVVADAEEDTSSQSRSVGHVCLRRDSPSTSRAVHARSVPSSADRWVGVVVREVGQQAAAVGRLPPEELVRGTSSCRSSRSSGFEVIHARALVDLRQLPVVAEGIRVPADLYVHAELLLEVALCRKESAGRVDSPSGRLRSGSTHMPPTISQRPSFTRCWICLNISGYLFLHPGVALGGRHAESR